MNGSERVAFIHANTTLSRPPLVPEIQLHLASEAHDLWLSTEEELGEIGLPPPFWAFAWAGGQALARHILDNPGIVRGKRTYDLASGSGLVAIVAKMAEAAHVIATDIDVFSITAMTLNAKANSVTIQTELHNRVPMTEMNSCEIILAGDVFYDRQLAEELWPLLHGQATAGRTVLIGDPGRAYLPKEGLDMISTYQVPVTRALEDSEIKHCHVWQVKPR